MAHVGHRVENLWKVDIWGTWHIPDGKNVQATKSRLNHTVRGVTNWINKYINHFRIHSPEKNANDIFRNRVLLKTARAFNSLVHITSALRFVVLSSNFSIAKVWTVIPNIKLCYERFPNKNLKIYLAHFIALWILFFIDIVSHIFICFYLFMCIFTRIKIHYRQVSNIRRNLVGN